MSRVTFKVDTDRLNCDVGCLMESVRKIMLDVEEVNIGINELSTMWKGEANAELVQSFNSAHQWMVRTLDMFERYNRDIDNDKTEYNICEARVRELVSSI